MLASSSGLLTLGALLSAPALVSAYGSKGLARDWTIKYDTTYYNSTTTFCDSFNFQCHDIYPEATVWLVDCVTSQPGPTIQIYCGANTKASPNVYDDYTGDVMRGIEASLVKGPSDDSVTLTTTTSKKKTTTTKKSSTKKAAKTTTKKKTATTKAAVAMSKSKSLAKFSSSSKAKSKSISKSKSIAKSKSKSKSLSMSRSEAKAKLVKSAAKAKLAAKKKTTTKKAKRAFPSAAAHNVGLH